MKRPDGVRTTGYPQPPGIRFLINEFLGGVILPPDFKLPGTTFNRGNFVALCFGACGIILTIQFDPNSIEKRSETLTGQAGTIQERSC